MANDESIFLRYQDLQEYVGWTDEDARRVAAAGRLILPQAAALIDDFYAEIQRHPSAKAVITGGRAQVERLKKTLHDWLTELFTGQYDETYVLRRWRGGLRHVEIGLPQVYAAAALSRIRDGMMRRLSAEWSGNRETLVLTLQSLSKLLDLDLAVINDAYEKEYVERQQKAERQRFDDVLHREKELSAGLLAHAQAAVVILDRSGQIIRCNPFIAVLAAEFIAGSLDERDWFELFLASSDRDKARKALLIESSADLQPVVLSSRLERDGQVRHLQWSVVPLQDALGGLFALLAVGQDVTELHRAQSRALQAERLAAIGQMATGLAHESRNALQRIGTSAEMLEMELEGNASAQKLVARIQQSQIHLHQLLEEVRTYAAPIILDPSPCRISEVWREAWELLHVQRRGRDAQLHERIVASDLFLEADRFRLVQVFRNLLENALAAASDPVRIELACETTTLATFPAICVRVHDNGSGLSPEQRRRIFEPFYTTKPTGTGLGTAIAQRLVEAHGGSISVGETPGPGAEIVVTLPTKCPR